jgi:protein-S-isoprenylcysteine O-methyltransferase
VYQTVFFITLGAWLLFEAWLFLREGGGGKPAATEARRTITALAIAVALAMNAPGLAPMLDVRHNFAFFFWSGIAVAWWGLLFRIWAVRTLGRYFSTQLVVQPGHELITSGPYQTLRHPSYTGGLMILSGLGVSLGNGLSLAILLGTGLVVYGLRIRREERMLAQALGARYEAFRKHTWAVIPFVW